MSRLLDKLTRKQWEIGIVNNGWDGLLFDNPEYLWVKNPYKDRWFADPFILDVTEEVILLLVEEYRYAVPKGRIAKLTIDRMTMSIKDMIIVLEEDTHLSFPAIRREKGRIYVYPENAGSGTLKLYELKKEGLQYVRDIAEGKFADAICTTRLGGEKMLTTVYPNYNGAELLIKDIEDGSEKKYKFNDKHARMAGDLFEYNGEIYRPSQVCNRRYGEALLIEKIKIDDNGELRFEFVKQLESKHKRMRIGMHTLNVYGDIAVVDVHGYSYLIGNIIGKMLEWKKKWRK